MGKPSKEDVVLELFFNEPTKHWHFVEIVKQAKISQVRANYWLCEFEKKNYIQHIKPEGKMPYFIARYDHPDYINKKKLYALSKLTNSGFLSHLQSLSGAKLIILFGSFARSDWNTESDIDLFILGDCEELDLSRFWSVLHREIEPHVYKEDSELKELGFGLVKNIMQGYLIKGDLTKLIEAAA